MTSERIAEIESTVEKNIANKTSGWKLEMLLNDGSRIHSEASSSLLASHIIRLYESYNENESGKYTIEGILVEGMYNSNSNTMFWV